MAHSLKQIRRRIRSVEGTKKITHVMEMVSSAKMRPLQRILNGQEEYFTCIEKLLFNLLSGVEDALHPLLLPRKVIQRILVAVFTSDTGLCGNYNSAIIHKAEEFTRQHQDKKISLLIVGKKGLNYFKKRALPIEASYTELYGHYSAQTADKIAKNLTDIFLNGKADEAYAVYTPASRHEPIAEKILNIENKKEGHVEYITEPDVQGLISELIPLYISAKVRLILLRAFSAENAARAIAMHEATDNAKDLVDSLVLLRNKIRQANITEEIIEIISSVNAMKG